MRFLDVVEEGGRSSCFEEEGGRLRVVGGLPHGARIAPRTRADAFRFARHFIQWATAYDTAEVSDLFGDSGFYYSDPDADEWVGPFDSEDAARAAFASRPGRF